MTKNPTFHTSVVAQHERVPLPPIKETDAIPGIGDRVNVLAHQLASDAARSDIESYCETVVLADIPERNFWYDSNQPVECCEVEHATYVLPAIEYLTLRGKIERHPLHHAFVRPLIFKSAHTSTKIIVPPSREQDE